jgi:multiple sugar transport system permease protein
MNPDRLPPEPIPCSGRRKLGDLPDDMAERAGTTGAGGPAVSARRSDVRFKWLLVTPAALLILALSIYPLLFSIWVLFVNYDFQIPGHAFVGLKNFRQVVTDPVARGALWTTVWLTATCVATEFLLGLALAMAMVGTFRGRGLLISILIVPLFISPVIVGQAWALLLQRPFGPTNYLLGLLLGQEVAINWLTQWPFNFLALILADVWQWTPFMFVILLSALANVDRDLVDAAALDGANRVQAFFRVVLPTIRPVIVIALVIRGLDLFRLFDIVWQLTRGGPGNKSETVSIFMYIKGFQGFETSYVAALVVVLAVLLTAVVMTALRRLEVAR